MKIVSKSYNIREPLYKVYDHYKDILIAFKADLLKAGIKRVDYEDVDFCGAEGITIMLNCVTNPKAWKILEEDFGYEPYFWYDDKGEEYE
jgi:hypothetical protein